jgi:hypothetical protein
LNSVVNFCLGRQAAAQRNEINLLIQYNRTSTLNYLQMEHDFNKLDLERAESASNPDNFPSNPTFPTLMAFEAPTNSCLCGIGYWSSTIAFHITSNMFDQNIEALLSRLQYIKTHYQAVLQHSGSSETNNCNKLRLMYRSAMMNSHNLFHFTISDRTPPLQTAALGMSSEDQSQSSIETSHLSQQFQSQLNVNTPLESQIDSARLNTIASVYMKRQLDVLKQKYGVSGDSLQGQEGFEAEKRILLEKIRDAVQRARMRQAQQRQQQGPKAVAMQQMQQMNQIQQGSQQTGAMRHVQNMQQLKQNPQMQQMSQQGQPPAQQTYRQQTQQQSQQSVSNTSMQHLHQERPLNPYRMQLMLLEQQNNKRQLLARQAKSDVSQPLQVPLASTASYTTAQAPSLQSTTDDESNQHNVFSSPSQADDNAHQSSPFLSLFSDTENLTVVPCTLPMPPSASEHIKRGEKRERSPLTEDFEYAVWKRFKNAKNDDGPAFVLKSNADVIPDSVDGLLAAWTTLPITKS